MSDPKAVWQVFVVCLCALAICQGESTWTSARKKSHEKKEEAIFKPT